MSWTDLAEVDGNRTRRTGITHPTRFEGGGAHQALGHLRRGRYRRGATTPHSLRRLASGDVEEPSSPAGGLERVTHRALAKNPRRLSLRLRHHSDAPTVAAPTAAPNPTVFGPGAEIVRSSFNGRG